MTAVGRYFSTKAKSGWWQGLFCGRGICPLLLLAGPFVKQNIPVTNQPTVNFFHNFMRNMFSEPRTILQMVDWKVEAEGRREPLNDASPGR